MKRTLLSLLICLLPAVAFAGEGDAPSANEVLQKADAAIKAVHAVSYKVKVEPGGSAVGLAPEAEGQGYMSGWDGAGPAKFYGRVKSTRQGETVEVEGGGDGESYFLIDHTGKKAYEDIDPLVLGRSGNLLRGLGMAEYVHAAPFDDELRAERAELQGTEDVGGVLCHKVHVVYSGGVGESTWFFGVDDHLPRRRIRHFTNPEGEAGAVTITISDLSIDPKADPKLFKLSLPEGYEQIDDFAP